MGFQTFSGGIVMRHWTKMGYETQKTSRPPLVRLVHVQFSSCVLGEYVIRETLTLESEFLEH